MPPTADHGDKLSGKVALITGAANGIGRAIAERFAHEGASVVIADLDNQTSQSVVTHIRENGGHADAIVCDVSQARDAQRAVQHTVTSFGYLTTVVGSAAVFSPVVPIDELSEADWQRAIDVNLTGCFLISKYAIPHLKTSRGTITLIASQMAQVANAGQSAYCAT